jgi:hypothetical protein
MKSGSALRIHIQEWLALEGDNMKKGDIAKFKNPLSPTEAKERFVLLEDPDGDRVLVEGTCNLPIRPTTIYRIDEIEVLKE